MNFLQKFTKRDLGFAVLTGLITGTIGWQILEFLKIMPLFYSCPTIEGGLGLMCANPADYHRWAWLVVIMPILWILGVLLGYFLGQWLNFFNQFGKFATIGFTNFAVTAGALNIFLSLTDYTSGIGYSLISGASFLFGVLSSYIWNKYWAFHSDNNQGGGQEFVKFFIVTLIAFGVNVTLASLVVNYVPHLSGMDENQWANIGSVIGSASGLIFSFIGFKVVVFRK